MASRRLHEPQAISINPVDLGLPHPAGSMDPGDLRYRPRVVEVVEIWKDLKAGDETLSSPDVAGPRCPQGQLWPRAGSMSPRQSAFTQGGWGVHTLLGGIDPSLRFRPRVVRVVEIWKNFPSADETLSSPGVAGPRRFPEGQLSPRSGSMSPRQSGITQCGWSLHTLLGSIDPVDLPFRPRVVEVVEIWEDF